MNEITPGLAGVAGRPSGDGLGTCMNLVMGIPESKFRVIWIQMLSQAMLRTKKGFRMDSPRRTPPKGASMFRGERRKDKVGTTKVQRALALQRSIAR